MLEQKLKQSNNSTYEQINKKQYFCLSKQKKNLTLEKGKTSKYRAAVPRWKTPKVRHKMEMSLFSVLLGTWT